MSFFKKFFIDFIRNIGLLFLIGGCLVALIIDIRTFVCLSRMANSKSNSSNDDIDSRQSAPNTLMLREISPDNHLLLVDRLCAYGPFDEPRMSHDLVDRESLGPIRVPHAVEQTFKLGTEVLLNDGVPESVSMALTDQLIVGIVSSGGLLPGVLSGLESVEDDT